MDLDAYRARGFPGDFDRAMAEVPVAGIDREQAQGMIRLCEETESILYGSDFSPRRIRYRRGARPKLESIAAKLSDGAEASLWVTQNVVHPHLAGPTPANRGMTEEQLIESGRGWCNEQCRVFIALCEVMEVPARLCFLFHANGKTSHTATEVFLGGKWAFHDVQYQVCVTLPDGSLAEARELRRTYRDLARPGYNIAAKTFGRSADVDLLESIGICNYLIEGVEA